MIRLQNIQYSIGSLELLKDINWTIDDGSRVALIGENGAGKTTLFRIIMGEIEHHSGMIYKPREYHIGYLPQEEIVWGKGAVLYNAMAGREDLIRLEQAIQDLRQKISQSESKAQEMLDRLGKVETQFEIKGGYRLEAEAKKILKGLGFTERDFYRNLSELSGGWRMRVYLAKLLLQHPDLLLLDEPTNHLDLTSLEWLENYLKDFRGSIVFVSHDRFFIDRIAQEIMELENGVLTRYSGKYHEYEKEKRQRAAQLWQKWEEQQREIARQREFIDRFRYKASKASQVQSRIKQLEKMEIIAPPSKKFDLSQISFQLQIDTPSYKHVIHIRNLSFRYDTDWIFENINFDLYRGERIALVGPNGVGKTTLTRLIAGHLRPQVGTLQTGERVKIAYYAQHQIEQLNLENTIIDEVSQVSDTSNPQYIRSVLGLLQFSGDDIFKKVGVLSGGEKARVSLAKVLLSPANFLIMDEPTNHLDLQTREALEEALKTYEGTLMVISHDRYFLDKIVHKIVEVGNRTLQIFEGNYSDYLRKREEMLPPEKDEIDGRPSDSNISTSLKNKEKKRKEAEIRQAFSKQRNQLKEAITQLETTIENLENRKSELEKLLANPETYKDGEKVASLQIEYAAVREELQTRLTEWESVQEEYDRLLAQLNARLRSLE
ncbi:MAG: ABC-F family ATP-binding cassette domain-containing protein [Calditrichia bacterium]